MAIELGALGHVAPGGDTRRVLSVALIGMLWMICFELGVRLDDRIRFGTPVFSPFHSQGQLTIRDVDGMHGRPHASYRKWVLNNHGMRGPDFELAKARGTFRVATIGASETFGLYEPAGKEYPRQLQDSLEKMRLDGRCKCVGVGRFEVINAALLGMSLPTVVQDVSLRLGRFSPDMIVLYPSPAQYLEQAAPAPAKPDSSVGRNQQPPLSWYVYPRAIDRIRETIKQSLPASVLFAARSIDRARSRGSQVPESEFREAPRERLAAYERDMSAALDAISAARATPFVVTHANVFGGSRGESRDMLVAWLRFYPRATGRVPIEFDSLAAISTARIAREKSAILFDWNSRVRQLRENPFEDFAHHNEWGSGVLAGGLASEIVSSIDSSNSDGASVPPEIR
ncbi:hypothetical protein [Gemmatimonas groenlandica]|uniref:SGNH/GDSL hydrolase family protein n=1 Tax=Gemmatimonas groenlandica TaxID=2732249 RepID=A0A6M4INB3_9BACT|nr:hypothetical protein [Gemmatimonas groenlandica]QJR36200.1 hypothetical protein HKW67_12120 [Gemmatimonas groenlandica]